MAFNLVTYLGIHAKTLVARDRQPSPLTNNLANANPPNYETMNINFNEYLAASMQGSLQQMTSSLQSNQALQASALVGRKVLVNSDRLSLGTSADVKAAIDISAELSNLTAFIYTETGKLIKTIPLGPAQPGLFQFSWDGTGQNNQRVEAGNYRVSVRGIYEGKEVSLKTMTSANVDSVSLGQNGDYLKLNVAGLGSVPLDQVRQITI